LVVTTNAGGTGRWDRYISPRFAPLPPAKEVSCFPISSRNLMKPELNRGELAGD